MFSDISTRKPNIIVIGDIMLDVNNYIKIAKIANEAPIPVYNIESTEYKLGGCGNVLQNLFSLGCNSLHIFSIIGDDEYGKQITTIIDSMKINNYIYKNDSARTITKIRYFCDNKIIFRSDIENTTVLNYDSNHFKEKFAECIASNKIDCIILSDYNKGLLTEDLCQYIIQLANENNIFTCVDPKDSCIKYRGCSLIKPNRSEAYKITKMADTTELIDIHKELIRQVNCKYSVITLSEKGITLYDGDTLIHKKANIHKIIDVTGAGDIVCCLLGYLFPYKYSPQSIIKLTVDIATHSVEFPGTYIISKNDIYRIYLNNNKQLNSTYLSTLRDIYSTKKIVFTNGCFDLLHEGHLSLLKFCREHGDIVVVGINSDTSIKRLKGPTRPIQAEKYRAELISSLSCVDYVVVFEDDTPLNIIKELTPDILVKGGDYTIDKIIGREYAKEVIIYNTIEGVSTTRTISKIIDPHLQAPSSP
jgi:D-beta-D-heptose 7-phosphate kinase/D-beta-D-heptose 1-phosphate adenosyltransferase